MKVIFILFLKEHISSEIIHSAIVVDDDEVGIAIINFAKQSVEQIEFIHEELLSEVPSAMTKKRRSNTVKKIIKMQMDSSSLLLPPNSTKPIDESCDNKIINLSILQNNFHLPQNVQVKYLTLFLLFSVIDGFEWFRMESLHKNIQLMLEFLKGPILDPTLYLLYINDLPGDVICNIATYAGDSNCYSKQLELASERESDLRDTVHWGKKWLVDFNAGKT